MLEHFVDYKDKARTLLEHCRRLCVVVPYLELDDDGHELSTRPGAEHVRTFHRDSFDFPVRERLAEWIVPVRIFLVPLVWSWSWRMRVAQWLKNIGGFALGRRHLWPRRRILLEIISRNE